MLNRRDFLIGCAGCALALGEGCLAVNPAPLLDADAEGTVVLEGRLKNPGDQIKVRLPGVQGPVLVWRGAQGVKAASIVCTHRGSEVAFNAAAGTLDCPSHGSRFGQDGQVVNGPASRPLASFQAAVDGDRLTLRRA